MWLPSENVLNPGTAFLFPTETGTLTIPSTASRTIGVGHTMHLLFPMRISQDADKGGQGDYQNRILLRQV